MAKMTTEDKKWRTESDVRTLTEARTIHKDKPRLSAAQKMAREQSKALGEIQNLGS